MNWELAGQTVVCGVILAALYRWPFRWLWQKVKAADAKKPDWWIDENGEVRIDEAA